MGKGMGKGVEETNTPWEKAIVMICTKCSGKIMKDHPEREIDPAEHLKKEMRTYLKEQGHGKEVRVVTSSCLDVCPINKITVACASSEPPAFKVVTVDPDVDPIELTKEIIP